jgi:hypothetical protein
MTGDGRGPGEEKRGPEWIAMERREEKKRKISYRENLQDKEEEKMVSGFLFLVFGFGFPVL